MEEESIVRQVSGLVIADRPALSMDAASSLSSSSSSSVPNIQLEEEPVVTPSSSKETLSSLDSKEGEIGPALAPANDETLPPSPMDISSSGLPSPASSISSSSLDTIPSSAPIIEGTLPNPTPEVRHPRAGRSSEDPLEPAWSLHKKHFFILSSAGKPIFSRYGDESKLSTFMGVLNTFVSFIEQDKDIIRYFRADAHHFVFVLKGPLYLVCVSSTQEPVEALQLQLNFIYDQILAILTSGLNRLFQKSASYDLRSLLGGTENVIGNLIHNMNHQMAYSIHSIRCLRLPRSTRQQVGDVLLQAVRQHNAQSHLVFAILLARDRLVQLARPRKQTLHASDLLLLMNFVNSSNAMRSSETWTPVCLPKFNDKGFMYAYIDFVASDLCLVMISTKADAFFALRQCKETILTNLLETHALEPIITSMKQPDFQLSECEAPPEALHFVFRNSALSQYTQPIFGPPYRDAKESKRLLRTYQRVRSRIYADKNEAHKLYFMSAENESILAWVTREFEMYVAFGPFASKAGCIVACNKIKRWLKKEEETLFIISSPVW